MKKLEFHSTLNHSKTTSYSRNSTLEKTEKHMVLWIEDYRKQISIDGKIIKEKALRIYNWLQKLESSVSHQGNTKMAFNTSHGWLTGFLRTHAFHNVKNQGELASADGNAAKTIQMNYKK